MRLRSYGLALGFALVVTSAASAAPIIYSGVDAGANSNNPRPNSNAAATAYDLAAAGLGPVTIIDFESAPLGAFTNLTIAPGVSMNGTDFNSQPQTVRNTAVGSPDGLFGYNTTSGGSKFVSLFGGDIIFSFAPGVQGFGGYLSGVQLNGETVTFFDGTQQSFAIPNPGSGVQFWGFTDAGRSIASVRLSVLNDIVGVDDVRVIRSGNNAAVPEPASLLLLGSGLVTGVRRWRKRQNG